MTTPSSVLAWRIPWTEEPGELQSIALLFDADREPAPNTHTREPQGKGAGST